MTGVVRNRYYKNVAQLLPTRLSVKPLCRDIHLRLDPETYKALKTLANTASRQHRTKISQNDIARAFIVAYIGDPMGRVLLPPRRDGVVQEVEFKGLKYFITFNYEGERILECFCAPNFKAKEGSDMQALITDACIAISKLLQHGETLSSLVKSFGENRGEGEPSGPASSLLGTIARAGLQLEENLLVGKFKTP